MDWQIRHQVRMKNAAEQFDAAPDSVAHTDLRDTAWMGGPFVEGRYLLGMLTQTNLFRVGDEEYIASLQAYITDKVSSRAAEIFCTANASDVLIPYLRRAYEKDTAFPAVAPASKCGLARDDRTERGIEFLLHHLDASIGDVAEFLQTTEKQVLSLTDLKVARMTINRSRSAMRRE